MSYEILVKDSVSDTADMMSTLNSKMTSMGWTLHDDMSSSSPPYYVWKSLGETGNEFPMYLRGQWDNVSDTVEFFQYFYWNNTTHAGYQRVGPSGGVTIGVDDDSSFFIWIYGDKDSVFIVTLVSGAYDLFFAGLFNPVYPALGVLQSSVSSGSSVTLTLAAGEADTFKTGSEYHIIGIGQDEGCERVTVDSINTGSNQITVDALTRGLSAGSMIGDWPRRWVISNLTNYGEALRYLHEGLGPFTQTNAVYVINLFSYGCLDPSALTGRYTLTPTRVSEGATYYGYSNNNFMSCAIDSDNEHTLSINELDSGTATSGASTTLTDTSQSWASNEYQDKCLIITGGTGVGQIRKISSNTATVLTVSSAFTTTPDATSEYVICDKGYRYWASNQRSCSHAVLEIG